MRKLAQVGLAATLTAGSLTLAAGAAHAMDTSRGSHSPSRASRQTKEARQREVEQLKRKLRELEAQDELETQKQPKQKKTQEELEKELQELESWKPRKGYQTEVQKRAKNRDDNDATLRLEALQQELSARHSQFMIDTDLINTGIFTTHFSSNPIQVLGKAIKLIEKNHIAATEVSPGGPGGQRYLRYEVPMGELIGYVGGRPETPSATVEVNTRRIHLGADPKLPLNANRTFERVIRVLPTTGPA